MSQDSNTILQGMLKQQGLGTTRPQYTNVLYGTVVQTDVSIAPLLPVGAESPIPKGTMTVAVAALGSNYVTPPILYPSGIVPPTGSVVAIGFTPDGTPICLTSYAPISGVSLTYVQSFITANVTLVAGTWTELTSIALTAGTWEIHIQANINQNTAASSPTFNLTAGTVSGSNTGGLVGANYIGTATTVAQTLNSTKIIVVGASETIYLNVYSANVALIESTVLTAGDVTGIYATKIAQ